MHSNSCITAAKNDWNPGSQKSLDIESQFFFLNDSMIRNPDQTAQNFATENGVRSLAKVRFKFPAKIFDGVA